MRVMTYNIHDGIGLDGRFDLERIAAVINESNADLVGLQEVPRYLRGAAAVDSVRRLCELTERYGAFGASYLVVGMPPVSTPSGGEEWPGFGNALLSRYPIRWTEVHPLPYFEYAGRYWERRSVLEAEVCAPDGDLAVFVTHFGLDSRERLEQARAIVRRAVSVPNPLVVMGDFNALPGSEPVHELARTLVEVRPISPPLASFPAGAPDRQLDYIWIRGLNVVTGLSVLASDASDHLAVFSDLSAEHER
jgi:endonuclease/exonuclease/phosphatase family metal-dependent hydrolase